MQSIIRSSIKNKNFILKNRGQFLITRNYCNDHGSSQDNSISFEKFKENRELIKKKSELIKDITKSRLLGESEKVFKLQQQVSSIDKILDPKIEQFTVQSREQKIAELEIWKKYLERKGVTTRSQLKTVNKFEFERFKNSGLLDVEAEKQRVEKEKEEENERTIFDPLTGESTLIYDRSTPSEKIRSDPILRDAFPSPFVFNPEVESKEFEVDEDEQDNNNSSNNNNNDDSNAYGENPKKSKKEKTMELIKKMEEQSNKDPQFKLMVMNFLDDGVPLKDKLIFRDDFVISEETLKNLDFKNEDDNTIDEDEQQLTEEDKVLIRNSQQKLLDLQIREIFKDYKINSKLEEKRLNILFRNNSILRYKIQKLGAINEDGSVDMKKLLSEPVAFEELTWYATEADPDDFAGNYVYLNGTGSFKLYNYCAMPYENVFEDDIISQKKLDKLRNSKNLTAFVDEDGSTKEIEEILDSITPSEANLINRVEKVYGKNPIEVLLSDQDPKSVLELVREEDELKILKLEDTFEDHVILAPNEALEFPNPEIELDENRVLITKEDSPMVKSFKDRIVQEGRIKDIQTKIDHIDEHPELESMELMKDLKVRLYKEEKELEKDLLETNDPMMIRNFIKYKFDEQKDKLEKKKEEDFKRHSSTLMEVQREVTQGSLSEKDSPIYHPLTGKLFTPKKKHPKCLLCQNPNWQVDPINAPFLSLYLNQAGDILPRHYSGNCLKHQKKIARTIRQAKALGIFSYKKGTFTIHDPNVYSLTKSELEEYNKWYEGTYTEEELQQVYDEYESMVLGMEEPIDDYEFEFEDEDEDEDEYQKPQRQQQPRKELVEEENGEESKQNQQEQILLEFGMENNDLTRMYGKEGRH
ncbi:hypothetical protein ACTA71_010674 [Dictyostelium dimigraforme]